MTFEEEKMNEQKYEPHLMHFILISDDVFFVEFYSE